MSIDLLKLRIEADFMVDGKLLMLPVKGNGNMEINVSKYLFKIKKK